MHASNPKKYFCASIPIDTCQHPSPLLAYTACCSRGCIKVIWLSRELINGGEAQVVDARGHLAGAVVGEVLGCILGSHRGQQERLPLLANALVVVWPVGRGGLHSHVDSQSVRQSSQIDQLVSALPNFTPQQLCNGPSRTPEMLCSLRKSLRL